MMRYGIARFVGSWVSASGYRLCIKKVRKHRASVDFLDPRGAPIQRSYMKGAPAVKMIARYDDYNGTFEVDLWEKGKQFILDLTHEYNYELDPKRREALVPALTRWKRGSIMSLSTNSLALDKGQPANHTISEARVSSDAKRVEPEALEALCQTLRPRLLKVALRIT